MRTDCKEMARVIKNSQSGLRLSGFAMGRRLDTRSLHRADGKYFSIDMALGSPSAAVALLIDESGSMGRLIRDQFQGQFSKLGIAKMTALILYDFCVNMGFPVMVAGHSTDFEETNRIEVMANFLKVDPSDRYRICSAKCSGGNRDGASINFMLAELEKRPEKLKMLFVISDGLPSSYDTEQEGIEDVQKSLANAQKNGVMVFASALKDDMPSLEKLYGSKIFDVTDLSMIPKILSRTVSRELRKIR